jgi:hypothetical protein
MYVPTGKSIVNIVRRIANFANAIAKSRRLVMITKGQFISSIILPSWHFLLARNLDPR